jgi:2-phosphosulfolactate phosphatase
VAVVIDVMRAFTMAAWAFARGTERIVLASSELEALELKKQNPDWLALKDGPMADGFDTVNSPGLVRSASLAGRTIVQKTTAGTVGALAGAETPLVLCASFAVADATARFLRAESAGPITFVITSEDGNAEEDIGCAEDIAELVTTGEADSVPYLDGARASRAAADLTRGLQLGYQGIHPDDIDLCLDADRFAFAMTAVQRESMMVLKPTATPLPVTRP